ncbi:MAG: hypothetical protein JSV58_05430 [Candidatus Bathyarchaeota archaeon]|nr:MAG: hypothetical protein JSV58_05430 [Candidatus Bathyarchaeota archaeon]
MESEMNLQFSPFLLRRIKIALLKEGFHNTRFQFFKEGQIFGLVKRFSLKQLHVRGFIDGSIKAELELWRFLGPFHLLLKPKIAPALQKLKSLLRKHGFAPFS